MRFAHFAPEMEDANAGTAPSVLDCHIDDTFRGHWELSVSELTIGVPGWPGDGAYSR